MSKEIATDIYREVYEDIQDHFIMIIMVDWHKHVFDSEWKITKVSELGHFYKITSGLYEITPWLFSQGDLPQLEALLRYYHQFAILFV